MVKQKIAIIGVGHIAHALLNGWFNAKAVKGTNIILSTHNKKGLEELKKNHGVTIARDNKEAVQKANIVFITVKPRDVRGVIEEVGEYLNPQTVLVSVAACVTFDVYEKYLDKKVKLVRIMPNIPSTYNLGVVGWIANKKVTSEEKRDIKALLVPLGYIVDCHEEEQINKVSMIAGSGPAYVAYFLEQLEQQAALYGFSQEQAKQMAQDTFIGALEYMKQTTTNASDFVAAVATKGGITEEVIRSMDEREFPAIFGQSLENGLNKIHTITKELKEQS